MPSIIRGHPRAALAVCLTTATVTPVALRAQPTAAQFAQTYEAQMQTLKPGGVTARTVLFQSVQAAGRSGNGYAFRVTALVHDYGPGYPANRYYGSTCVSKVSGWTFLMRPDGAGAWTIDGRMTPADAACKDNPAPGVSATPLAGLPGTRATATGPAVASQPASSTPPMPAGGYQCWSFGSPRPLLNFTVTGPGRYRASDGSVGTFRVDPSTHVVAFTGYLHDAVPAGYPAVYENRKGMPTLSIMSPRGGEAEFCQQTGG